MDSLQDHVRSRMRCTIVIARGRYAADVAHHPHSGIEADTRAALRDWSVAGVARYGEQFASDTGTSLGAVLFFRACEDSRAVLGGLDRALAAHRLERIRTRLSAATG